MSKLASIVPCPPLNDEVFPFNQPAFVEIIRYQEEDLAFLQSPPIKAFIGVGDKLGGASTAVTAGVGTAAHGTASTLFKGIGKVTHSLPGGGLLHKVGEGILEGIDKTEAVAEKLVDPTRVPREHYHYSNEIQKALPDTIDTVDRLIHDFAIDAGHVVQDLYENIPTKGAQILTGLENRLVEVDNALSKLYEVLTKNNIEEVVKVGRDKYKTIARLTHTKNYLSELGDYLPEVLKTTLEVKAAFATILANYKLAQEKIKSGITDPTQIFAEKHEDVVLAWKVFENKRKTMTYLPYKY